MGEMDVLPGQQEFEQTEAVAETQTGRRLCGYSGCRALLPPPSGPGNRARYCQDGKTWGPKNATCKQAGNAEDLLASLRPDSPGRPFTELAEHLDGALGPVRRLAAALEQARAQLETDVAEAHRERDEALRLAADERGLREAAEADASEADRRAHDSAEAAGTAVRAQEQAETERGAAVLAKEEAERARLRAETQQAEARERAERAEARSHEATEQARQSDRRVAATDTELTSLRGQLGQMGEQLDRERTSAESERSRADRAAADFEARATRLDQDHQAQLERLRAEQAEELRNAREESASEAARQREEAARLRKEYERARESTAERRAQELAALHRELGARDQKLARAIARAEAAEADLTRLRDGIEGTG